MLGYLSAELNRLSVDGYVANAKALARRHLEDRSHGHPRGAAEDLEILLGVASGWGNKPCRVDSGYVQSNGILQRNAVAVSCKGIDVIADSWITGAARLSEFGALDQRVRIRNQLSILNSQDGRLSGNIDFRP